MKLKGLFTFFSSIWRLPHFHSIITTYIFLVNVAKTELGVLSKLDSQNMYLWQLNGCVTNFYFRNWQRKFMCTDFLWLENHEPLILCFHLTSWRPYWCPKTMKRQPWWCPKPIVWEFNSLLMQMLSFVPINLHRCWSREWKHYIMLLVNISN